MSEKIKLSGPKADYALQIIPSPEGGVPVLIGVGQGNQGEIHILAGVDAVIFADGRIDLGATGLAEPAENGQAPMLGIEMSMPDGPTEEPDQAPPASTSNLPANLSGPTPTTSSDRQTSQDSSTSELSGGQAEIASTIGLNARPLAPLPSEYSANRIAEATSGQSDFSVSIPPTVAPSMSSSGIELPLPALTFSFDGAVEAAIAEAFSPADYRFRTDIVEVTLDPLLRSEISLASGGDTLVLRSLPGQTSPWNPDFMQWRWQLSESEDILLNGQFREADDSDAGIYELSPDMNWIATGSSSPLKIIRPDTLNSSLLEGTSGDDWLLASQDNMTLNLGAGNDVAIANSASKVISGAGINTIYSEDQDYTISYEASPFSVRVNLQNKTGLIFDDDMNFYGLDRLLTAPNNIIGSEHSDILVGNEQNNVIQTGGGSDQIWGNGGSNHFVIQSNPLLDTVRINDWSPNTGDRLSIDLETWLNQLDLSFDEYEQYSHDGQLLFTASLRSESGDEESALLRLMLSEARDAIYWMDSPAGDRALVEFGTPFSDEDLQAWDSYIFVDYL